MATKRKSNGRNRQRSGTSGRGPQASTRSDAITLLKQDHRQVEEWFEEFKAARSEARRASLAQSICQALKVHTSIEEEIFYPAFLEALGDEKIHHEAEVEHAGAKNLISQIERTGAEDEYFDARVTVLSEMIEHHVKEEEKSDGMFAKARRPRMDLSELGERLSARKAQLQGASSGTVASLEREESRIR